MGTGLGSDLNCTTVATATLQAPSLGEGSTCLLTFQPGCQLQRDTNGGDVLTGWLNSSVRVSVAESSLAPSRPAVRLGKDSATDTLDSAAQTVSTYVVSTTAH